MVYSIIFKDLNFLQKGLKQKEMIKNFQFVILISLKWNYNTIGKSNRWFDFDIRRILLKSGTKLMNISWMIYNW